MQTEIERIRDMVATLRKGFVNEPADVKGDPVEATLTMLEDIFRAVERPQSWYTPDKWGEFRRKMNGEPSPPERALEIKVQEDAALFREPRKATANEERGRRAIYEVKRYE